MDHEKGRRALFRTTSRHAIAQGLGVCLCTVVLLLFGALTYTRITLPRYTANYAQKDTQQVVNLIITVVATVIGILLSHCRRITNEAETKSELRNAELTIPRLHVHVEAAGGAHAAMGIPAIHNKEVWRLVAFYMFAIVIFGFLNSVMSIIFVIEPIISEIGYNSPVPIPISIEIPPDHDPCSRFLGEPGCAYDLGLNALTSELISYSSYTVGGVTFEPGNGTMGLPYWAMQHFTDHVTNSPYEEDKRSYCLPVMDPDVIHCTEEPFDQAQDRTNSSFVKYTRLDLTKPTEGNTSDVRLANRIYQVAIPVDASLENIKYRIADQAEGVMTVRMFPDPDLMNTTIITAADNVQQEQRSINGGGYASLLHYLMYGILPDHTYRSSSNPFKFVARCEMASIKYRDNYRSSWRQVDFTLKNGVSRANVTDVRCPNPKGDWTSGFGDLPFTLEGASDVISSTDGYSKLYNRNSEQSMTGTNIFQNQSRLDAIVNKIYHITQTMWTQEAHSWALQNETVYSQPVIMTDYPHLYIIRISWTPATYIGLVLSLLICLNAWALAGRWAWATYRFGFEAETWNLLRPVDLMAYSLAAYKDLIHDLNSKEHRRNAMHGKTRTVLRERPLWEGTQSLIGLVSTVSATAASSPVSPSGEKFGQAGSGTVTVEATAASPAATQ